MSSKPERSALKGRISVIKSSSGKAPEAASAMASAKSCGLVNPHALQAQLAPEKAEEVDLRLLGEDGDDHRQPAHAQQVGHDVCARLRTRDLEDDIGAGALRLPHHRVNQVGLLGI